MKTIVGLRESFVERWMQPVYSLDQSEIDFENTEVLDWLSRGLPQRVVSKHDLHLCGPLKAAHLYNGVIVAHIQSGNLPRAMDLCETGEQILRDCNDTDRLAILLTNKACILWRTNSAS